MIDLSDWHILLMPVIVFYIMRQVMMTTRIWLTKLTCDYTKKKRDVLEHVCNYFDDIFFFLANQPIRIKISRSFEFSLSNIWQMHFFCLSFSKKKKNTFPSWNVNLRVQKFYFWGYVSHNFVVFKGLKILNLLIAKHQPRHFWI